MEDLELLHGLFNAGLIPGFRAAIWRLLRLTCWLLTHDGLCGGVSVGDSKEYQRNEMRGEASPVASREVEEKKRTKGPADRDG